MVLEDMLLVGVLKALDMLLVESRLVVDGRKKVVVGRDEGKGWLSGKRRVVDRLVVVEVRLVVGRGGLESCREGLGVLVDLQRETSRGAEGKSSLMIRWGMERGSQEVGLDDSSDCVHWALDERRVGPSAPLERVLWVEEVRGWEEVVVRKVRCSDEDQCRRLAEGLVEAVLVVSILLFVRMLGLLEHLVPL